MFTLKKLALVSVVGLSALAISCGDDTDDDAGGTLTSPFTVTDGASVILGGTITANTGASITGLTIKADGNPLTILPAPTLPAATFSFSDIGITGACGTKTGQQSIKFEFTAVFSEGENLTGSQTASINCGGGSIALPLTIWAPFTLSSAGTSFADLDAKQTYGRAAAEPIINNMDLVAYIPAFGASGDKIYSTWDLDNITVANGATFFPIEATDAATLRSASDFSQITGFLAKLGDITDGADLTGGIAIASNLTFLAVTPTGNSYVVIVTATASSSVTLKSIALD
jgi:hypothetical protein